MSNPPSDRSSASGSNDSLDAHESQSLQARTKLSLEGHDPSNRSVPSTDYAAATQSQINSGNVTNLQLVDGGDASSAPAAGPPKSHDLDFSGTVGAVGSDLWHGITNEVTQHPGQLLEAGTIGLAVGATATAVALVAPEAVAVAAIGGALFGGYELATHIGGWIHDADVISHPDENAASDVANAHSDLQAVGAGTALVGAGLVGSVAGGGAMAGISGVISGSMADTSLAAATAIDSATAAGADSVSVGTSAVATAGSVSAGASADAADASSLSSDASSPLTNERLLFDHLQDQAQIPGTSFHSAAFHTLNDKSDIDSFVQLMVSTDGPQAAKSEISAALQSGQVAPDTDAYWQSALTNVRPTATAGEASAVESASTLEPENASQSAEAPDSARPARIVPGSSPVHLSPDDQSSVPPAAAAEADDWKGEYKRIQVLDANNNWHEADSAQAWSDLHGDSAAALRLQGPDGKWYLLMGNGPATEIPPKYWPDATT